MSKSTEQLSPRKARAMESIKRNRDVARAAYLVEQGFRTKILHVETGMSESSLRALAHGINALDGKQVRLSSGTLPEPDSILRTRSANAEGTIFMLIYLRIAGEEKASRNIDIDAVIKAHRIYLEHRSRFGIDCTDKPLDINRAWVLARDYRVPHPQYPRSLELRRCIDCGAPYLVVSRQRHQPQCPFCAISPSGSPESGDTPQVKEG